DAAALRAEKRVDAFAQRFVDRTFGIAKQPQLERVVGVGYVNNGGVNAVDRRPGHQADDDHARVTGATRRKTARPRPWSAYVALTRNSLPDGAGGPACSVSISSSQWHISEPPASGKL